MQSGRDLLYPQCCQPPPPLLYLPLLLLLLLHCTLHRFNYSFDLQLNVKLGAWLYHRVGCSSALSRVKELGDRGNWIFDTCHFHSAAPYSLATHKDFSCHSLVCYHEWAQVLRNPITTTVSDSCHHGCYSHVPQIRKDVLTSSFSFLQTSLPPPFQSVCLRYELQLFPWTASLLTLL